MLDFLPAQHPAFNNPLATPPPDDSSLDADVNGAGQDLRILDAPPVQQQHPTLAYDTQHVSGLPDANNTFRYARASFDSAASAASGGDSGVYSSAAAFVPTSDAATSATSVSGYPSSPPPSRQRSDNGCDPDTQSGDNNRYSSQSPVSSPVAQPATASQDRLNMPYHSALAASGAQDSYSNLTQTQTQSVSQSLAQRQSNHMQQHSHSLSQSSSSSQSHSSIQSPSDRFPSLSSMIPADRYRMDKYTFPPPIPERRMSEPQFGAGRQYASIPLSSSYSNPSYALHRVNRSGSYSDLAPNSGISSSADWQDEEREKPLVREVRALGSMDSYSPITSSFSSTSSLMTGGLPSPHVASHHNSQGSQGYNGNSNGGYGLYGSQEDLSYNDGRPNSSSGDSNSPPYGYSSLPASGAGSTTPHAQNTHSGYSGANDPASKTYSFVSLPGNTVRKRPRRRYDEIERLYACSYPGCTKAYGTLNHLNAHVNMQKHGSKRHPNEFKELRKQWRKMKRDQEQEREARRQEYLNSIGGAGAGGPGANALTDIMRRRRATDPSLYGLSAESPESITGAGGFATSQGSAVPSSASLSDPLAMHSLDASSYAMSSGLPIGMDSMGGISSNGSMGVVGGYGHHHYAQTSAYHGQQRSGVSPLSPVSPTSPPVSYGRAQTNGSILNPLSMSSNGNGSSNHYYESMGHGQQGHDDHSSSAQHVQRSGASSPPPINRLPPDSTLLTPLHSHTQHTGISGNGYGLPSLSSIARMEHHHHQ